MRQETDMSISCLMRHNIWYMIWYIYIFPPHPQLAGQADDEGGGGEAVHQGGGGAVGVADHHREDEHPVEPRRRGLRPKKIVRYKL